MANPAQEPRLGARLRALRREHPTLAVLTEIVQLDERRVAFRATLRIDGETRAQGHAARGADPAGDFVAAAEQLAVEQALLLGGFDTTGDESRTLAERPARLSPVPSDAPAKPTAGSSATTDSPVTPAPRRRIPRDAQASSPPSGAGDTEGHGSAPGATIAGAPTPDGADANLASSVSASPPPTAARPPAPSTPLPAATIPAGNSASTAPGDSGAAGDPADPPPAPRRERDQSRPRQAGAGQGTRAERGTRQTSRAGTSAPGAAAGPLAREGADRSAPERPPAPAEGAAPAATHTSPADGPPAGANSAAPGAPPAAARRRVPSRTADADREALRAAWQVGRPIPAWWPPDRIAVARPLTRSQVERLRAVAVAEEITAAQLDTYSTMLFGSVVAELTQAQGAILEERLNPAYPSPLEELSARRVIHPIAVGDTVAIPEGQSAFIRWRDVPPVEDVPVSPAPAAPSWRAGGAKRGSNRRRR